MRLLSIFLFISLSIWGNTQLKIENVRETFEEMLGFHVEYNELSPVLIKRASKFYMEQFDSSKMYFLDEEAKKISSIAKKKLENVVKEYQKDDLSHFIELNQLICQAINRARQYRLEVERELILSVHDIEVPGGEVYLTFPEDELKLKHRIRKQLVRLLFEEKQLNQMENWTPKDREKIFNLWERRFQRKEGPYLKIDEEKEHDLALHSLRALSKSLDAHSYYFSPQEAHEMRTSLEKQFEGVGVILREGINGVVIVDLVKGGPAEKSGKIEIGDQIAEIGGVSVKEMTYEEVLHAMKGDGEKELILGLVGKNNKLRSVTLRRERIMMNEERLQYASVPCGEGQIGILTLPSFYEGGHDSSADRDIREAIKKLRKTTPLKGVILDIRENSGGFLSQAVKVAGLFITRGVVVISKYSRDQMKYLRNLDGKQCFDGPLIVLTSRASASAAEIVAQALQDYGVALVVGDEETYGKGTIQYQTVTDKEAKAFYKVTVGRYYTVSGRSTQIVGVKADIVVPTIFASYKIGERFLENPLPTDQVAAAYIDPLTDIDYRSRIWFQKNYLPNLHQPQDRWQKALPQLKKNSEFRLSKHKNFSRFLQEQGKKKGLSPYAFKMQKNPSWGEGDLQMEEAVNIMQDMIEIQNQFSF